MPLSIVRPAPTLAELIEDGKAVEQETRLYDADRNETRSMRTKEDAQDYRYFPDPDLPPLVINEAWIERVRSELPELPEAKRQRFTSEYRLSAYDAALMTDDLDTVDYFERALVALDTDDVQAGAKHIANLMAGDLAAALNRCELSIARSPVTPSALAGLARRLADNTLSTKLAKDVFAAMWAGEGDADAIIGKRGLRQISDTGAIEKIVDEVLAASAATIAEYKGGKEKAFNSLVGKVMAATKGKANPAQVNAILKKKLGE